MKTLKTLGTVCIILAVLNIAGFIAELIIEHEASLINIAAVIMCSIGAYNCLRIYSIMRKRGGRMKKVTIYLPDNYDSELKLEIDENGKLKWIRRDSEVAEWIE